ncbi:hypothetical protein O6H91_16G036500 [Diphasiastrum complanatum]|uniref:Uncharacterized protein n=1 Tax=Diphasiastrum complanatum TaxID=34168 RepID=A0ACC2BBH3_DIPCM|nr:hypothetical protein O6H91_16G036500 [Diphasiastrum complanatum]
MEAASAPTARYITRLHTLPSSHSGGCADNVRVLRATAGSSILLKLNAPLTHKYKSFLNRRRSGGLSELQSFWKPKEDNLRLPRSIIAEYQQESAPVESQVEDEKELEEQTEKLVEVEHALQDLEEQTESLKGKFNGAVDRLEDETVNLQAPTEKAYADSTERAIGVLRDTTEQLREQTEKAKAVLATAIETAEKGKENLAFIAETAPEPIKDIAETALNAHSAGVPKKGAKIHDFCLGIPYGGLLAIGGLLSFIITGSTSAIRFGVILGGLILFSSVTSLKVWKRGESSMPFIKAQAAITLIIFARDVRRFLESKAFFPAAVMCLISAGMVGFYGYVYFSGGNPPKKAKADASVEGA